jgi:hypothetical protein
MYPPPSPGQNGNVQTKRTSVTEIVGYASPLNQAISFLLALLVMHAIDTMIFLLMTLSSDVIYESYFLASKSCHVFLPLFGAFYAAIAYQKPYLEATRKTDFMDVRLILTLVIAGALLVVDVVFFAKDTVPTIKSCYQDPIPPVFCTTNNERIAWTALVALRAGHIVVEALIVLAALWVRWANNGDAMYQSTEYEKLS